MVATARRLLFATGAGAFPVTPLPTSWGISRYAGNPVLYNLGGETHEMYVPAVLKLASGNIWAYVKGAARIYAWKSTDGGETFTIQNGGSQVVGPGGVGTWDHQAALEPVVVYDEANGRIHLWYKGWSGTSGDYAWGHATASDSDPTTFTKDLANPILTRAAVATALGNGTVSDLGIGDVILIGSTFHFYGYCVDTACRLIQATGTTWSNPTDVTAILTASGGDTVVETPAVFRLPGTGVRRYVMFYAHGGDQPAPRAFRVGTSFDGVTWDFSDTTDILSPASGWESNEVYSGHLLKESTSPWSAPVIDGSGRWKFYYSGLDNAAHAQSGLAYLAPV